MKHFDILVVGGGHAGVEAAAAAGRMGADVALITMRRSDIGVMSCNPAIGGLGKGHLVREIDALGGIMAEAGDRGAIQYRLLNRRKGPAVQGPRTQADRKQFQAATSTLLDATPGVTLIEGEVVDLSVGDGDARVVLADDSEIRGRAIVLTTGTFLNGVVHIGDVSYPAGRADSPASQRLASLIRDHDLSVGRLKTGTPPRLDGRTIRWDELEKQPGDESPTYLSFRTSNTHLRQVPCGITHTNSKTHDIIRANLDRSAMYGGHIESVGPRYCPSIEDKVVRFGDKDSHQIFLEPEGLDDPTVYPNGISTSLPEDVQLDYVRSIFGLEQVEVLRPGYAIEYDYVDPRALTRGLMVRNLPGLFLAGQINGTTGYEEAGAQGLMAGLNAVRHVRHEDHVVLSRSEAYIGVLIDDLVTKGVNEPYRMFTSRAEFRLNLRADNADQRLTDMGRSLGLIGDALAAGWDRKRKLLDAGREALRTNSVSAAEAARITGGKPGPARRSVWELLGQTSLEELAAKHVRMPPDTAPVIELLAAEALYEPYIERQLRDQQALQREEGLRIPADLNYDTMSGLTSELRSKLKAANPETLGQAGRIAGMTPAALSLILARLRRRQAADGLAQSA
ncbi:tRNA uridine-5-carboxymethylaminomethyl(34) synthesis enzyme MnmG [Roseicyclus sp. F158]|uniref:tRNA uridine 5-carboxymethylaminomethyl modification enzyme MnmG n=1 Tax=Tropicimonas omnivorans TaxID=3075590 RepID=A0ABU3DCQ2_9RHOB|nr:tRNA uridine-5-carboxymethylaminomethyl(34) synthesis enzyme MnmG [Roseicyclus sp. F158]MDT0681483.1 tRNA uridine-5-carboxymethylaminomethyl(34) synthesis enzyme MnmG [Roseicyclus sp. F158]